MIPLGPLARAARGNSSVRRPVVAGFAIGGSDQPDVRDRTAALGVEGLEVGAPRRGHSSKTAVHFDFQFHLVRMEVEAVLTDSPIVASPASGI